MANQLKKQSSYEQDIHRLGRGWGIAAILLLLAVPAVTCFYYDIWPPLGGLLKGLLTVCSIYVPIGIIEVFNYSPMLGAGGSYLAFVTGNISNMKVPAAATAMELAGVKPGTKEGEIISTIAVAMSSIVTTLVILLGVLLMIPLQKVIQSTALKPAFDNVLPALFGALILIFINKKNYKVAVIPVALMIVFFLIVKNASLVGLMVPVASLIAIGIARILYRKNWI